MQNRKANNIIKLLLWFSTCSPVIDAIAIDRMQSPSPDTLATDPTFPLPRGSIPHVVAPTGTGGWWNLTSAQSIMWMLWIFNFGSCVAIISKGRGIWALVRLPTLSSRCIESQVLTTISAEGAVADQADSARDSDRKAYTVGIVRDSFGLSWQLPRVDSRRVIDVEPKRSSHWSSHSHCYWTS